jgi:hypothetical protein
MTKGNGGVTFRFQGTVLRHVSAAEPCPASDLYGHTFDLAFNP